MADWIEEQPRLTNDRDSYTLKGRLVVADAVEKTQERSSLA